MGDGASERVIVLGAAGLIRAAEDEAAGYDRAVAKAHLVVLPD